MLDHILCLIISSFLGVKVLSFQLDYKLQEGKLKSYPLSLMVCYFLASHSPALSVPFPQVFLVYRVH